MKVGEERKDYYSSITYKALNFLANYGIIPRSKLALVINSVVYIICISIGLWGVIQDYFILHKINTQQVMTFSSDISVAVSGLAAPMLNFWLQKRHPAVFQCRDLKAPKYFYILLFILISNFITSSSWAASKVISLTSIQPANWKLQMAVVFIGTNVTIFQQMAICSHLFLFGCIVEMKKDNDIKHTFSNDQSIISYYKNCLTEYQKFKESVSVALFLFFTLKTVVTTLNIYVIIALFRDNDTWENLISQIFWCLVLCMYLVYLALVCDDFEVFQKSLISHLW